MRLGRGGRLPHVQHQQAVESGKVDSESVSFRLLWQDPDQTNASSDNNNSVVLALTLGWGVSVIPARIAEAEGGARRPTSPPADRQRGPRSPAGGTERHVRYGRCHAVAGSLRGLANDPDACSHVWPHGHRHTHPVAGIEGAQLQAYRTDTGSYFPFATENSSAHAVRYLHV
jgi:hypothetical protein